MGVKKTMGDYPMARFTNSFPLIINQALLHNTNGSGVEVMLINGTFKPLKKEEIVKGDVNGDGRITSVDALIALQMSVGKLKASEASDMNGDGKVLANDALEIMKIAVQHTSYSVGG